MQSLSAGTSESCDGPFLAWDCICSIRISVCKHKLIHNLLQLTTTTDQSKCNVFLSWVPRCRVLKLTSEIHSTVLPSGQTCDMIFDYGMLSGLFHIWKARICNASTVQVILCHFCLIGITTHTSAALHARVEASRVQRSIKSHIFGFLAIPLMLEQGFSAVRWICQFSESYWAPSANLVSTCL